MTGWPIFKVADIAVVAGAALFVLSGVGAGALERASARPPDSR